MERLKQSTPAKFDSNTYINKKRRTYKSTRAVASRRPIRTIVAA